MADSRARLASGFRSVLISIGLAEDEQASPGARRGRDLAWAVLGPVIVVLFVWSVFGRTIGLVSILVMLPFLVVGIREVLARSGPSKDR